MTGKEERRRAPALLGLHPMIYWTMIGLCVWLVLSVWGFLGRGYTGLVLTVVSLFVAVAVGIPVLLWRISLWAGRRSGPAEPARLADWLARDFEASPGRQRSVDAAVEVLLPIAAVAFGMSAFALALHIAIG